MCTYVHSKSRSSGDSGVESFSLRAARAPTAARAPREKRKEKKGVGRWEESSAVQHRLTHSESRSSGDSGAFFAPRAARVPTAALSSEREK